jgi:hypothetical protein
MRRCTPDAAALTKAISSGSPARALASAAGFLKSLFSPHPFFTGMMAFPLFLGRTFRRCQQSISIKYLHPPFVHVRAPCHTRTLQSNW